VFENRVLRRIFGPKRDEVTGAMEHHDLYISPSIIRLIKSVKMWQGHVSRMEMRNSFSILVGKPE
jgi:hypothetical protein